VFVQTPRSDVYVSMLGVALGAIVLACLLLTLILQRYEFSIKASWTAPQVETRMAANLEKITISDSVRL